jgi:hypothetical protein
LKQNPITEAERRQQLEYEAAEKRAKEAKERAQAEAHQIETAKTVYENMWSQFAADSKKSKSLAYGNLKANLADFAAELVPFLLTAKEHMALISEAETHIKGGDSGQSQDDPRELVASWLRGDIELSRIPLEKAVVSGS